MLGGIGDTIVCTPAMRCIRDEFPDCRISVLGREPFCRVLPDTIVDEIISYPSSTTGKLGLAMNLARTSWLMSVDFHTPTFNTVCSNSRVFLRNALFTVFANARLRCGFAEGANRYVLNRGVSVSGQELNSLNIVDLTARVLAGLGIVAPVLPAKDVFVPDRPAKPVFKALSSFIGHSGFCVLHLGSKQGAKKWNTARGAGFARALSDNYGLKTVLVGDEADRREGLRILNAKGSDRYVLNLAGRLSLADTAWLIQRSLIAVCVDSGPMHMADALGVPLVALFGGQQNNSVWYPVGSSSVVIKGTAPCSPCFRADCHHNVCMDEITVDRVMQAVSSLIGPDHR